MIGQGEGSHKGESLGTIFSLAACACISNSAWSLGNSCDKRYFIFRITPLPPELYLLLFLYSFLLICPPLKVQRVMSLFYRLLIHLLFNVLVGEAGGKTGVMG